jgi:uncharacterized protein (TIGR03790 family)
MMTKTGFLVLLSTAAVLGGVPTQTAMAGGGAQNMLLIVNPHDEASLRIAQTYIQARAIPQNNIVYLAPPTSSGFTKNAITPQEFTSTYVNALPAIIQQRGLAGQIDYIGTIGHPHKVGGQAPNASGSNVNVQLSFNYALTHLTQLERGMTYPSLSVRYSEMYTANTAYQPNSNTAFSHSTQYASGSVPPGYTTVQHYLSGNIGYSGRHAIDTNTVIDSLNRTVAADGSKPTGVVYFMNGNDPLRTDRRKIYWPAVQTYMNTHGIDWVEQQFTPGWTPHNRTDVAGAVVGRETPTLPNGSSYLAGAWADNMTSAGGMYDTRNQTKADRFFLAGAGATAGTVYEPTATQTRFTRAEVLLHHHDGSTLGESFFRTVQYPDMQMFQGDLLSQSHADMPKVSFGAAPADGSKVSGVVSIAASGQLVGAPKHATGVGKLELFVNGVSRGLVNADTGNFDLDTATLPDGVNEIRVVAYNNSAAQSQGFALRHMLVDNKGQSVTTALAPNQMLAHNQTIQVPVSATTGSGGAAVSRIELHALGRVLGQIDASSGQVALDASKLAFGANAITPVVYYVDGSRAIGQHVTVHRDFHKRAGRTPSPEEFRTPGFKVEWFINRAGDTIHQTDFSGSPDFITSATALNGIWAVPDGMTNNVKGAAVRITTNFTAITEGEHSFFWDNTGWTSMRLLLNGEAIHGYNLFNPGNPANRWNTQDMYYGFLDTLKSVYLKPGEYELAIELANMNNLPAFNYLPLHYYIRDPGGVPRTMDSSTFYTAIPEPSSAMLLLLLASACRRRLR